MKGSEYQILQVGGGGISYVSLKRFFSIVLLYNCLHCLSQCLEVLLACLCLGNCCVLFV